MNDAATAGSGAGAHREEHPREEHAPRTIRQWVLLGVAAVALAGLCVLAAQWQWARYEHRAAQIEVIEQNWSAEPVDVAEVLAEPGAQLPDDTVWQRVVLEGHYVPEATVLLRNRPVHGTPGFHVLVPFVAQHPAVPDGLVIVVDRGFVPLGRDGGSASEVPAPPQEVVRVTVSLRADEPSSSRGAPPGQVQAISTSQVLEAGGLGQEWAKGRTVGAYGALRSESPPVSPTPASLPQPDTDPGSHLSYAFQWGVFAAGALGGYVLLWRRERSAVQALRGGKQSLSVGDLMASTSDGAPEPVHGRNDGSGARRHILARPTADADSEDALIDAQLRR